MKTQTIISISWYKHIQLRSQTHINKSDHQSPLLPPISHQWTHQATTTQPTIHPHPPLDWPPLHNHYHRSQPISLSLSLQTHIKTRSQNYINHHRSQPPSLSKPRSKPYPNNKWERERERERERKMKTDRSVALLLSWLKCVALWLFDKFYGWSL